MKNYAVIEELYYSYLSQRKEASSKIIDAENRIFEINKFLSSVDEQGEDLKIFSPFDVDDIYDGKIKSYSSEREELVKDIEVQKQLIDELDLRIVQFREMMDDLKHEESSSESKLTNEAFDNRNIDDKSIVVFSRLADSIFNDFNKVYSYINLSVIRAILQNVHNLEMCSKIAVQDPNRAKIQIDDCITNLNDITSELYELFSDMNSLQDMNLVSSINSYIQDLMVSHSNVSFETDIDDFSFVEHLVAYKILCIVKFSFIYLFENFSFTSVMLHVKHNDDHVDIFEEIDGNTVAFSFSVSV